MNVLEINVNRFLTVYPDWDVTGNCRFFSPSPRQSGEIVFRPREREKVPEGRMRVVGSKTNSMAVVRGLELQNPPERNGFYAKLQMKLASSD